MFIQRINEGDKLCLGLNWISDEMTFLSIKLMIPITFKYDKNYYDFDTDNSYSGLRCRVIYISFRIRRWKNFSAHIKKFIFHYSLDVIAIGKQERI